MKIKFKEVLESILKQRNQTAASLAKQIGVPKSVFHTWLLGGVPSSKNLEHVYSLSRLTGMPLEQLLFGDESRQDNTPLFTSTFVDRGKEYKIKITRSNVSTREN